MHSTSNYKILFLCLENGRSFISGEKDFCLYCCSKRGPVLVGGELDLSSIPVTTQHIILFWGDKWSTCLSSGQVCVPPMVICSICRKVQSSGSWLKCFQVLAVFIKKLIAVILHWKGKETDWGRWDWSLWSIIFHRFLKHYHIYRLASSKL